MPGVSCIQYVIASWHIIAADVPWHVNPSESISTACFSIALSEQSYFYDSNKGRGGHTVHIWRKPLLLYTALLLFASSDFWNLFYNLNVSRPLIVQCASSWYTNLRQNDHGAASLFYLNFLCFVYPTVVLPRYDIFPVGIRRFEMWIPNWNDTTCHPLNVKGQLVMTRWQEICNCTLIKRKSNFPHI